MTWSLAIALGVFVAGCGGNDGSGAASPSSVADTAPAATSSTPSSAPSGAEGVVAPNGEVVEVSSIDNTFRPGELTITAGTEVVFTNDGRNDHDVTPVPSSLFQDWGITKEHFAPGDVYTHVFDRPGTYEYVCTIHGVAGAGMVGTITVTG